MRLLALLSPALLAASTAFAADAAEKDSSSSSSASSSESSSSSSSSIAEEPTPLGEIWSPKWTSTPLPSTYTTSCHSKTTFQTEIYKLKDLYPTLKDFAPELKVFYHLQHYPGSWNGVDLHGDKRELLKMDFEDLPFGVREWLAKEENKKQRFFSVQEEVVFFAPGAIYKILPLWVDEAEGRGCEGVLEDLDNYSTEVKDGAVLGRVDHKETGKHKVEVTIEAFLIKKKDGSEKDEL